MHGRVVDALGARIVGGELGPSDVIDPEHLAEEFDVSRTVMRESLRVLGGKGLVDARPRLGTFARDRSAWNLLDPDVLRWQFAARPDPGMFERLHELRVMIEPAAADLAARRRTDADIEALARAVDAMAHPDAQGDQIVQADQEFHLGLLMATHNDLVEQLSTVVGIGIAARDRYVYQHSVPIERGLDHHRLVLDSVRAADAPSARARMLDLLDAAAVDIREVES